MASNLFRYGRMRIDARWRIGVAWPCLAFLPLRTQRPLMKGTGVVYMEHSDEMERYGSVDQHMWPPP